MKVENWKLTNLEYIAAHRDDDIRSLALKPMPEGVDAVWCLTQIEGYQLAKKKLPRWAETEGIIFPPRLSMEQCSSELTAEYKASIVRRLGGKSLADLTGGFGVDFSYMARDCEKAVYVERQEVLCDAARNNFPLLGLNNIEIVNCTCEDYISKLPPLFTRGTEGTALIYLDPARRDDNGRKVAAIEDCTPNLAELQDTLLEKADYVIVKLSPMLDITQAMRVLHFFREVHIVSVKNECKEILFVLASPANTSLQKRGDIKCTIHCVNLGTDEEPFITATRDTAIGLAMPEAGMILVEPNASIMKAGLQDSFALRYGLKKIHPMSHLYIGTSGDMVSGTWGDMVSGISRTKQMSGISATNQIPGRVFRIKAVGDFSKASIKSLLGDVKQANLTIRNFPSSVAELRKRLKIKEGGSEYLFATTLMDGSHALIRCEKI